MKKTKNIYVLLLIILLWGCDKDTHIVYTIINSDGSCIRQYKVDYSKNLHPENYYIAIDSTWKQEMLIDTLPEKPDSFWLYTKAFNTVQELNTSYNASENVFSDVKRTVSLNRKFKWFYTEFSYKETYEKSFEGQPMTDFIRKEDFQYMELDGAVSDNFSDKKDLDSLALIHYSDSLENQYELWINTTIYNALHKAVLSVISESNYGEIILSKIDSLKRQCFSSSLFTSDVAFIEDVNQIIGDSIDLVKMAHTPGNPFFDQIQDYENKLNHIFSDPIAYELELPGILTYTNADSIVDNTMHFYVSWEKYFTTDCEMIATSKYKNMWAVYVSIALAITAILAVIAGYLKKGNERG